MNKKRILFFHFDLRYGGAEKVLVNLLNNLDLSKYDLTLQTVFGVGENKAYLNKNIRVKSVFNRLFRGSTFFMKFFSPAFLYKLLVREDYDIVVAYLENSPTRILSGCSNPNTKKFAWVHVQISHLDSFFAAYRSLEEAKSCYEKYDKVVFVSDFLKVSFIENTGWNYLPVTTIYNTLEIDMIKQQATEDIDLCLHKDKLNFCSVGRLVTQKGFDRLFRVFKRLKEEHLLDNCHFYLFGQGELENELQTYVSENMLNGTITFCGYKANPYKYVSKMDMFLCSSYREGFSTAVTESVIVGTPVLTTDCSGMGEILDNGKYGILVENSENGLYEGIKSVLEDYSLVAKYKKMTKERALFFNKENTVRAVETLFDTL